jgi:hypothetical protein
MEHHQRVGAVIATAYAILVTQSCRHLHTRATIASIKDRKHRDNEVVQSRRTGIHHSLYEKFKFSLPVEKQNSKDYLASTDLRHRNTLMTPEITESPGCYFELFPASHGYSV